MKKRKNKPEDYDCKIVEEFEYPISAAELYASLKQVAERMNSTIVPNGNGTFTLVGPYGERALIGLEKE